MRQPPKALPMGLSLCTIWSRSAAHLFQQYPQAQPGIKYEEQLPTVTNHSNPTNQKIQDLYPSAERDKVTKGINR